MSIINKYRNDQWLQYHSVSCARLLNIGLNSEVYLYDLKIWLVIPTCYNVTNLVGLTDSDCIYIYIWLKLPMFTKVKLWQKGYLYSRYIIHYANSENKVTYRDEERGWLRSLNQLSKYTMHHTHAQWEGGQCRYLDACSTNQ